MVTEFFQNQGNYVEIQLFSKLCMKQWAQRVHSPHTIQPHQGLINGNGNCIKKTCVNITDQEFATRSSNMGLQLSMFF